MEDNTDILCRGTVVNEMIRIQSTSASNTRMMTKNTREPWCFFSNKNRYRFIDHVEIYHDDTMYDNKVSDTDNNNNSMLS